MSVLVAFEQTITDAERRIENAHADGHHVRHALTWGCGVLEGYYRAGAVSKVEYQAAAKHLRSIADSRIAVRSLQQAALAAGLGSDG